MDAQFTDKAHITLSHDELRVVGLALAGKLKDAKDKQTAADLNRRILEARLRNHEAQAEVVRGALANLTEQETQT